ncbi:DUF6673 family protein [Bacillus sp. B15-48]|uniref:DUF6673 family protein n=1 Tax=Bacillus sp. B15-48 TaxID=1548601 RepID=UPI00193F589C|nr:DUF6673 family protein [Bacillus sp. B15-48]MBM4762706.1 hypothetical protein [Bacillus sp. B15-48]
MAIKIQTQKPEIPVEIGDLTFAFNVSDESVKKFRDEAVKVQKELENIAISDDEDKAIEQSKEVLKRGFNIMLGDGAFEKVYDISPSVMICMQYFVQLAEGIEQELRNMGFNESQQEKAKKYLMKNSQSAIASPVAFPLA